MVFISVLIILEERNKEDDDEKLFEQSDASNTIKKALVTNHSHWNV